MQRSSSIAHMKIQFNPQQAKIGHSSIDKLPIHRCNSSKSISQATQNQQKIVLQTQQYNIQMLKRINISLQRQNQHLKKQLDFFTKACSSRRVSLTTIPPTLSKKQQNEGHKTKILNRIDIKNDNQSTGLYNSKFSNQSHKIQNNQNSISQLYVKYKQYKILPSTSAIQIIVRNFYQSIKSNYLKLRIIIDQIYNKNKQNQKIPKLTNDILMILQMIVLYSKNAKVAKNLLKQKQIKQKQIKDKQNKDKSKIKFNKNQSKEERVQEIINQFSSTNDLILLLETIIKAITKNTKCLKYLKTSVAYSKLLSKVAKNQ